MQIVRLSINFVQVIAFALTLNPIVPAIIIASIAMAAAIGAIAIWLAIAVHELAHYLAFRAYSLPVVAILMSGLRIQFNHKGEAAFEKRPWIANPGGAVLVDFSSMGRGPLFVSITAGAVANIVLGSLLLVVNHVSFNTWFLARASIPDLLVSSVLLLLGVIQLLMGIGNLIPMRAGMFLSDGALACLAVRGGPPFEEALAATRAAYENLRVRPRDAAEPKRMPHLSDETYATILAIHRFWATMDAGKVFMAEPFIREAFQGRKATKNDELSEAIAYETAIYFTRYVDDLKLRSEAAGEARRRFPKSHRRMSLEGAEAWVRGDFAEADRLFTIGESLARLGATTEAMDAHIKDWYARLRDRTIPTTKDARSNVGAGSPPTVG